MPRSPTHAPSLPLAGISAPHFRNYHSHCAQNKPPLSASAAGVGLILPLHRKAPHSPFTPPGSARSQFRARGLYSLPGPFTRGGGLHSTSGTNIRTTRKPRPLWAHLRWGWVLSFPRTGKPLTAKPRPSGGGSCAPLQELTFALHANQGPSERISCGGGSYPSPAPESPSQPNHAPLAAIPAPHFRNEYSPHTPTLTLPAEKDRLRHLLTVC